MNPRINKTDAIAALKAGAVLRSGSVGSVAFRTLTTVDGRDFRMTRATFTAVLDALGPQLSTTSGGRHSIERRFVADPASLEPDA